jgi:DNA-directed RNA polymerase subunit M/transcription elongation factor TFIIS
MPDCPHCGSELKEEEAYRDNGPFWHGDVELVCENNYCTYKIKTGEAYRVELSSQEQLEILAERLTERHIN